MAASRRMRATRAGLLVASLGLLTAACTPGTPAGVGTSASRLPARSAQAGSTSQGKDAGGETTSAPASTTVGSLPSGSSSSSGAAGGGSTSGGSGSPVGGSPTTSTTIVPAAPALVGWGATKAQWYANHTPDPLVPNGTGFWPRNSDGLDTYASLRFVDGRALFYVLNLEPPLPVSGAEHWVLDELPPDAHLVLARAEPAAAPTCEVMVFTSRLVLAVVHRNVLAVARSLDPVLDPAAIWSIQLSPIVPGAAPPANC